jgi:hypothetical protein
MSDLATVVVWIGPNETADGEEWWDIEAKRSYAIVEYSDVDDITLHVAENGFGGGTPAATISFNSHGALLTGLKLATAALQSMGEQRTEVREALAAFVNDTPTDTDSKETA